MSPGFRLHPVFRCCRRRFRRAASEPARRRRPRRPGHGPYSGGADEERAAPGWARRAPRPPGKRRLGPLHGRALTLRPGLRQSGIVHRLGAHQAQGPHPDQDRLVWMTIWTCGLPCMGLYRLNGKWVRPWPGMGLLARGRLSARTAGLRGGSGRRALGAGVGPDAGLDLGHDRLGGAGVGPDARLHRGGGRGKGVQGAQAREQDEFNHEEIVAGPRSPSV